VKLILENWRKYLVEEEEEDRVDLPADESDPHFYKRKEQATGEFTQKPSYLLFHFPSKKLHWVNTSKEYAFKTPSVGKLPPGKIVKTWRATSGNFTEPGGLNKSVDQVLTEVPEWVQKKIKDMHMIGPLPAGAYTTRDPQEMPWYYKNPFIDVINSVWNWAAGNLHKKLRKGKWPGGKIGWGTWRVWLAPAGADVGLRKLFSIHGGMDWGSAGCIDLRFQINNLQRDYEAYASKYDVPMLLYSEYSSLPKELFLGWQAQLTST